MNLKPIQTALSKQSLNGWLFCDFHNREKLAYSILGLDIRKPCSRRWFYFIPHKGTPLKLVHAIESGYLDALPGKKLIYSGWVQLHENLKKMLRGQKRVAMQYSPMNNIPTISTVDAGTVELVRSSGANVVSSADLVQRIYSVLDAKRFSTHQLAGVIVQAIKDDAFELIFSSIRKNKALTELDVQQFILARFKEENLTCGNHAPIVGANEHAADPHFEPTAKNTKRFKKNDRVLIDLWAKRDVPGGIFYDITWCGFIGTSPPPGYKKIFGVAVRARDTAIAFIEKQLAKKKAIRGWEVDKACRDVIAAAGYGPYFVHRTGHSIDTSVHGQGANIDGLETKDDRLLLPGALFSIEPGIYKGQIGVRTEVNVYIDLDGRAHVEGAMQKELLTPEL